MEQHDEDLGYVLTLNRQEHARCATVGVARAIADADLAGDDDVAVWRAADFGDGDPGPGKRPIARRVFGVWASPARVPHVETNHERIECGSIAVDPPPDREFWLIRTRTTMSYLGVDQRWGSRDSAAVFTRDGADQARRWSGGVVVRVKEWIQDDGVAAWFGSIAVHPPPDREFWLVRLPNGLYLGGYESREIVHRHLAHEFRTRGAASAAAIGHRDARPVLVREWREQCVDARRTVDQLRSQLTRAREDVCNLERQLGDITREVEKNKPAQRDSALPIDAVETDHERIEPVDRQADRFARGAGCTCTRVRLLNHEPNYPFGPDSDEHRQAGPAKPPVECTGIAAVHCPLCGDCTCPEQDVHRFHPQWIPDGDCPLHGDDSMHADEPDAA